MKRCHRPSQSRILPMWVALLSAGAFVHAEPASPTGVAGSVGEFTYKTTPQGELAIHLHFPEDWTSQDKRPAIVFFFGGGWARGSVEQFTPQAEYFAKRGLVAARADYRVRTRHGTTADKCVEDSKSAVRWLREHADRLGIDPKRIVGSGGSAGGHTAAATAIVPGFEAEGEDRSISSQPNLLVLFNPALKTSELPEMAGSSEIAQAISVNEHMDEEAPPAIIFFGTKDRLLPMGEGYLSNAKKLGLTAELYLADGQGHGFFNRSPWKERTLRLADRFLARYGYTDGEPTISTDEGEPMSKAEVRPSTGD